MDELERIERIDRAVPYDLNAERSTLGSILLDRDAIIAVAGWLHPEYFYLQKHAYIYEAMLACYNRRIPPDLTTVIDELRRQNRLEQVGGIFALSELAGYVPTAVHVEYYARIVERTAIFRRLIEAGGKITALGYAEHEEVEDALDKAEAELFAVSQRRTMQDFVHIGSVIDTYFEQVSDLSERRSELVGLPTGYYDLDKLTGGLQRSDLLILAARPSVGKTSLALSLAYHAGVVQQHTVAIFSLEMSREQLVQRLLAMHTGIDTQRLRTGNIDRDLQRVMEGMGVLSSAPIFIDDTPALSIMEMRSRARRLHAQSRIELIVVDYLQLMQGRRSDNRVQEVSEISRGLKALARELNVPVLALSQLSRSVEGRTNHVPMLSDLRESGCLAGDTLVYLPETGDYCRIDALVGQHGFNVLALDPTTYQLVACPVERAFTTGEQLVYTLTTRLGRTIRATANHKFLTVNGWVRLDALTLGQRIALPRQIPSPTQQTLSDAEVALLGHLIGDGCTLPRHTIQYTTNDGVLAQMVATLSQSVFGTTITPRIQRERTWYQVYLCATQHLTHQQRNPIAAWLDTLGVFGLRSHEKRVPAPIFRQPAEIIGLFLKHLWATDGSIQLVQGKHPRPLAYYATSSPLLARQVQSLLLRLSINARLVPKPQHHKGRTQYHVVITGKPELLRFLDLIGAIGQQKQVHAKAIRDHVAERVANTNRDVIPRDVWHSTVRPAMAAIGLSTRQMQAALGTASCGTALYQQNISRERAAAVARVVSSPHLAQLAQSDVYWDEIVSITPNGVEPVYDLTVARLHNFVANDIIVHNSIEQDADIVMFIYREDMYDRETDKKGIAEIHIAKHRNGPLGVVPLRFEATTTSFQNLEHHRYDARG